MATLTLHTSDRSSFKRCKRRWGLSSPWQRNLTPVEKDKSINLWFGSGFHFALEDYHGYNKFGSPVIALEAYYNAFRSEDLPERAEEMMALGMGMFDYYLKWGQNREKFETLWHNGQPMVECSFELEIKELTEYAKKHNVTVNGELVDKVTYHGTIDKIVTDSEGRWWLVDYKTAASIDTKKLSTDPQISAYLWAAEQYYDHEIAGMIFLQFLKDVPEYPKRLAKGGFSTDKRQKTPHSYYREALIQEFGKVPPEYIEILNELASRESIEGNKFIRSDKVERNGYSKESTYYNIIEEGMDMLDQIVNPRLYPNFTRDCAWDCSFRFCCIAMEEGHDADELLSDGFEIRNKTEEGETEEWRKRIKWPQESQQEQE